MIEVEIKIKIKNRQDLAGRLEELGFQQGDRIREEDIYFNSAFYDLREKDMALRIRKSVNLTTGADKSWMTYKGPKLDTISMTRKELEMEIGDGQVGEEILASIGYDQSYHVKKRRKYFHKGDITACLDQVYGLGNFLELEILVEEESDREKSLDRLIDILEQIGYQKEDVIQTSYLSMLQQVEAMIAPAAK